MIFYIGEYELFSRFAVNIPEMNSKLLLVSYEKAYVKDSIFMLLMKFYLFINWWGFVFYFYPLVYYKWKSKHNSKAKHL